LPGTVVTVRPEYGSELLPIARSRHFSSRKDDEKMILGKFWRTIMAQVNKLANYFWTSDPIAQMQYEYDQAVDQLKGGREGLEQYQALVQRVSRQVAAAQSHVSKLEAQIKAYLLANDRDTAAKFALELQRAKQDLEENQGQLKLHEESYNNNVTKIKHAMKKLGEIKIKIAKYDAELKMSRAEAEMAKLATDFNFDVTTDFGQIEEVIQDKIGLNRAKAKVAADLSGQGLEDIKREQAVEKALADDALKQFEVELGLAAPETAKVGDSSKELGPPAKVREQQL
jgi:phage shock protein A